MIRSIEARDRAPLSRLLAGIENFTHDEAEVALELIDGAIEDPARTGYHAMVLELDDEPGRLGGYLCWGPTPMTERTYDLYWVAVDRTIRGRGLGRALCLELEREVAARGGGNIRIETSSKESYGRTLQFYLDLGYDVMARLPDFYAAGDELITLYRKVAAG
jgi:ribosomal protein S18 acetylase RimI-like enzyme